MLNELPHRGGNAVAEVVSRSSGSRTHPDPRLAGLRPTKLHKIKNLYAEVNSGTLISIPADAFGPSQFIPTKPL